MIHVQQNMNSQQIDHWTLLEDKSRHLNDVQFRQTIFGAIDGALGPTNANATPSCWHSFPIPFYACLDLSSLSFSALHQLNQ
jgi:hypothetical protein